jgi:5-hydroxyisourate hydrolase
MTTITTHVLDTARGRPAAGIPISLERATGDGWEAVGSAATDADGRVRELGPPGPDPPGRYRLTFDTGAYLGEDAFFPQVSVDFRVEPGEGHYHVPLLLSPYGYSTYRGS